ncbi:GNAT family N-acetyltransferase [Corynebacterium casei]|uniref:GNAT family N-acetyltransferase n=1 Tax=Corynebacterium casei TaxID=160386 RepID=UPI003FCEFD63
MFDPIGWRLPRLSPEPSSQRHPFHPGWPEVTPLVLLPDSKKFPQGIRLRLRPLVAGDKDAWRTQRIRDEKFLRPVEPTAMGTWKDAHSAANWRSHFHYLGTSARAGQIVPMAIEANGQFAGQLTLGNIQHGGISDCWIGYWVYSKFTGSGVATAACGLVVDHAFRRVGLHRITATYMPENQASGKVLAANGFREEGYLRRNLHINGAWRDHHFVAITREDYSTTALDRLCSSGRVLGRLARDK